MQYKGKLSQECKSKKLNKYTQICISNFSDGNETLLQQVL